MRVRHKIPSIFNLSMVDVLCCALGCVILLWLINVRSARDYEDATANQMRLTQDELQEAQKERARAQSALLTYRTRTDSLEKEKASLLDQRMELTRAAAALDSRLKDSQRLVADLGVQVDDLKGKLAGQTKRANDLQTTANLVPGLQDDLKTMRDKLATAQAQLAQQQRTMDETSKTLAGVRSARTILERDLAARDQELAALRPLKERLAASEVKVSALEKLLAERGREATSANQSMEALKEEKKIWQTEAMRARAAMENRFAGITLTGRRVIFLVDMSGSMDLIDEKNAAPGKWAEVAATVGKVMRSLPELQKYQVIVFSDKPRFLLGNGATWLDYKGPASAAEVEQALLVTKPKGGTNMYEAFQAAFRFRAAGLDTVYLMSDGLPNMGEGVPEDVARNLTESQVSERLAKHIRKVMLNDWNSKASPNPRVKINTIGFFYESPDIGSFLWPWPVRTRGASSA